MNITSIPTDADYVAARNEIESLMTAKANTPEGNRLHMLATLVEAYERTHFPMDVPDAVETISRG
jgi:HTH-type transcriptional regulator/antitoxin HigA